MSYLDIPRLHFFGEFIAEPSTINNSEDNLGGSVVDPQWNPNGDHRFQFSNCKIVALNADGTLLTAGEPLLQKNVTNPPPTARIVDLDVATQMASQIFGLKIQISDGAGNQVRAQMATASFRDFDGRRFLGIYQSVLEILPGGWQTLPGSWLDTLRQKSPQFLSVRFITDLFSFTPDAAGRHKGRVAGVIGPATTDEPHHFVRGRRLVGAGNGPSALAMQSGRILTLDVGNIVPLNDARQESAFIEVLVAVQEPASDVALSASTLKSGGLVTANASVLPDGWRALGTLDTSLTRYGLTSGVESLALSEADGALASAAPLALFTPQGALLAQETPDGMFIFPDRQAFWVNPGQDVEVKMTACRFGVPAAGVPIEITSTMNPGQVGVTVPPNMTTGADGKATVRFATSDPGRPRQNIDGQVFGFGGPWANQSGIIIPDARSAIVLRVFSGFTPPTDPKWETDILSLFEEYDRLYPAMKARLALSDYDQVVGSKDRIRERLLLPLDDPRYMPVSRDLSDAVKTMIIAWIDAGCPRQV